MDWLRSTGRTGRMKQLPMSGATLSWPGSDTEEAYAGFGSHVAGLNK